MPVKGVGLYHETPIPFNLNRLTPIRTDTRLVSFGCAYEMTAGSAERNGKGDEITYRCVISSGAADPSKFLFAVCSDEPPANAADFCRHIQDKGKGTMDKAEGHH